MSIIATDQDNIRLLTFNHEKPTNPFSFEMMRSLMEHMHETDRDDDVQAVVLYGGEGRSFSAGGDFKQVIEVGTRDEVTAMLHLIIDVYVSILSVNKPVIAAIDGHAIGFGFQIACLTDYRLATEASKFFMPELKNGIACTLGGVILEYMLGRKIMMDICYDCEKLDIHDCERWGLVNKLVQDDLLGQAYEKARQYGSYPNETFRSTKRVNNARFIAAMEGCRAGTIRAHWETISKRNHVAYMETILKRRPKD